MRNTEYNNHEPLIDNQNANYYKLLLADIPVLCNGVKIQNTIIVNKTMTVLS